MPKFLDYGQDLKSINKTLTAAVVVLVIVVVFLAIKLGTANFFYIDPTKVTGVAQVGYVPPKTVEMFASHFVHTLMNVTPDDALSQYKAAYVLMSTQLASKMKTTLEAEIATIQKGEIFVQTVPIQVTLQQTGPDNFTANVTAHKTAYSFGKIASEKYLIFEISVHKIAPKVQNPFGLEVTSYDYKETDKTAAYPAPRQAGG